MTHTPDELRAIARGLELDAHAFRENTVYDSEGDPMRLVMNAERMEAGSKAILALLDRLAALKAELAEGDARVVAWLIEFPEAGDRYEHGKRVGPARPVEWLAGVPWGERWKSRTIEPNKAIRFARKADAESAMLIMQLAGTAAFASEHIWMNSKDEQATRCECDFSRNREFDGSEIGMCDYCDGALTAEETARAALAKQEPGS